MVGKGPTIMIGVGRGSNSDWLGISNSYRYESTIVLGKSQEKWLVRGQQQL